MSPTVSRSQEIEILYQEFPKQKSRLPPGWKSKTESKESFRKEASHELGRLLVNGTIPDHIVQVNYLAEFSVKDIKNLWQKHSRRLRDAGIVARVTMEITKDEWRQRPVNRVHYHFVAKDKRTRVELKTLFERIYQSEMKPSDFKVGVFPFNEARGGWKGYIRYFVKLYNNDHYLFTRGLWLRQYFTINEEKFWTYPDCTTSRTLTSIEKQMQRYMITKHRLQKAEKIIAVKHRRIERERSINYAKLTAVLDKETDRVLYDWYSILLSKPTVFQTKPPAWLIDNLQSQLGKREALLKALIRRLQNTDSLEVYFALQIYHTW